MASLTLKNPKEITRYLVVVALISILCFITYYFEIIIKTHIIYSHLFYFPIILACYWWKKKGLIVPLFLSGILILFSFLGGETVIVIIEGFERSIIFTFVGFSVSLLSQIISKNERYLSESEEKYRLISENANDLIAVLNSKFEHEYINEKAYQKILGYSNEDMLGKTRYDIIHPDDYKRASEVIRESFKKGEGTDELRLRHNNGKYIWVENKVSVFKDSDGQLKVITVSRVITERKLSEQRLKESEEKYRYFFNNTQVGLFWSRISDGKFLECNDTFAKLVGYDTREECLADYIALEHYVDLNTRNKMLEEIRINNGINDFEIRVTKRDGTPYWASISARTNLKENRLEGAAIDITARKEAERELQLERDNLINILSSMEDGVYIVDKNYDIEYVNPILIQEFGQYEGMKCYTYFHDRNESCPWCNIQEVFEGKTVRWEWHSFKNQKTYDLIDTPLKNVDGSVSKLEIFHDITERKKVADKLFKINRTYQMLSECNLLLVNAKNESELFDKLCKIVVEVGGYRLAWIGLADNNEQKTVSPIAQAGFENGYLESLNITWSDTESGRGPTGTAIRTGKSCIAKNILTDPKFKPWREQAIKRGYVSSIALPLSIDNVVIGSLNIYSAEKKAFDIEEDDVLINLANNLAYGVEKLRSKVIRRLAEQKLKTSEVKYRHLFETSPYFISLMDAKGVIIDCNDVMDEILSIHTRGGLIGKNITEIFLLKDC